MKSTELRIGNWINFIPENSDFVVSEINSFNCEKINGLEIINLNPIPLTEEWILKFHPNALDLSNQIFRVGRFKLIWKFSYEYWYIVDDMTGAYMTKLDFVHEWQNFWHIMNGEELTINKY